MILQSLAFIFTFLESLFIYKVLTVPSYDGKHIPVRPARILMIWLQLVLISVVSVHMFPFGTAAVIIAQQMILIMTGYIDRHTSYIWRTMSFPCMMLGMLYLIIQSCIRREYMLPLFAAIYAGLFLLTGILKMWGMGDVYVTIGVSLTLMGILPLANAIAYVPIFVVFSGLCFLVCNIRKGIRTKSPYAPYMNVGFTLTFLCMLAQGVSV